jgi:hypothetical protein
MPDLLVLWKNALMIIGDPKQVASHASAQAAVKKVTTEWKRCGSSSTDEKGFKWPTTVANGGNGKLGLENRKPRECYHILNIGLDTPTANQLPYGKRSYAECSKRLCHQFSIAHTCWNGETRIVSSAPENGAVDRGVLQEQ